MDKKRFWKKLSLVILILMIAASSAYATYENLNISVPPSKVSAGENITVTVTVENVGEIIAKDLTVIFTVDGESVEEKTLTIPANESVAVPFNWTAAVGDHKIGYEVLDDKGAIQTSGKETIYVPQTMLLPPQPTLSENIEEFVGKIGESGIAKLLANKKINLHVTLTNESISKWKVQFDERGNVAKFEQGEFLDRNVDVHTSETTAQSIIGSDDSNAAFKKALDYNLITIEGVGITEKAAITAANAYRDIIDRIKPLPIASTELDTNNDRVPDTILEVEGRDIDGDGYFDIQTTTVLNDTNNDGKLDSVSSKTEEIIHPVLASVELDTNGDGKNDTIVEVEGRDTDNDDLLDIQTITKLTDTTGDGIFDSVSETTEEIKPSATVSGEWDSDGDGKVDIKVKVGGTDTNNDGKFDIQTTTVYLDTTRDGEFDTVSETTEEIRPLIRASMEFDTNGDGKADTKAEILGVDTDTDGKLDIRTTMTFKDTNNDGIYDSVSRKTEEEEKHWWDFMGDLAALFLAVIGVIAAFFVGIAALWLVIAGAIAVLIWGLWRFGRGWFKWLWDKITYAAKWWWEQLKKLWNWFVKQWKKLWDWLKRTVNAIRDALKRHKKRVERRCIEWEKKWQCDEWGEKWQCDEWGKKWQCDEWWKKWQCDEWWKKWQCGNWHWLFRWLCKAGRWVTTGICKVGRWVTTGICKVGRWVTTGICKVGRWVTTGICKVGRWVTTGICKAYVEVVSWIAGDC